MLEPMIIPKLLIHLADFPYVSLVEHRAPNPLVLMRFGTSARQLFSRGNCAVRLGMTLGTVCWPASCHRPLLPRPVAVATWRAVGDCARHPLFVVSNDLLPSKERTRLGCSTVVKATTSKICSHGTSTAPRAAASLPPWCLPTARVSDPA